MTMRRLGLSPRRRGNRRRDKIYWAGCGPIPAQAGEPVDFSVMSCPGRAYPRAGGGTRTSRTRGRATTGLSPRRRGNHPRELGVRRVPGPIPAQAGEPGTLCRYVHVVWAYPRAGGGTPDFAERPERVQGLSPRRRGNHLLQAVVRAPRGPIPAQAGEPERWVEDPGVDGAYPRAGGGTSESPELLPFFEGLSPRRRGNPRARAHESRRDGPIPAQAGEPHGCDRM